MACENNTAVRSKKSLLGEMGGRERWKVHACHLGVLPAACKPSVPLVSADLPALSVCPGVPAELSFSLALQEIREWEGHERDTGDGETRWEWASQTLRDHGKGVTVEQQESSSPLLAPLPKIF